jgi:hypothetical protein
MTALPWAFDPSQAPDAPEFDNAPIPSGTELQAIITATELKDTSTGGQMLVVEHTIVEDGPYKNRKIWNNLNIVNSSEQAQNIGLGQLKAVCQAVGHQGLLEDSSMLHDKPIKIKTKVEKGTGQYEDKTIVSSWKPLSGAVSATAAPTQQPPAAPQAGPWANG